MTTNYTALAALVATLTLASCGGDDNATPSGDRSTATTRGVVGVALQRVVMQRAEGIARHNRPYVFDGVQDCYGYVRQVWNAILTDGSAHTEDFFPKPYNKRRWLGAREGLPVADAPSNNWVYFSNPSVLVPGDVLSTHKGHAWGAHWHGGIYAGNRRQWDNGTSGNRGAYNRPLYSKFRYYYRRTHDLLTKKAGCGAGVGGAIGARYHAIGGCRSVLGAPISGEKPTPDGVGRFVVFQKGSIYWTPETGAHEVHGAIRERWAKTGWEKGPLRYPISGEKGTPDGVGRYSVFQRGSIYWSPKTGAHAVHGAIRDRWAQTGWERGPLGYPTSDEHAVAGGRRSSFQHGTITWNASTGKTTVNR